MFVYSFFDKKFVSITFSQYFRQISLVNKSLLEAQQILKCGHVSGLTNLTIEYDVSVMQSVEFSLGPLLIEIERPMNEKLGIILSNYSNLQASTMDTKNDICQSGIFIAGILPASIADRCVSHYYEIKISPPFMQFN